VKKEFIKINNMWGKKVPELALKRAISLTLLKEMGEEKEVSVALVSAAMIKKLNFKYREKDSVTDVLAFPLMGEVGPAKNLLGEIVICPEIASLEAGERGHSLQDELILLVIHGTLHLLGYRDEKEEERKLMREKEREILRLLGEKNNIV